MSSSAELLAQRDHLVECIARTHENAVKVVSPELVAQQLQRPQGVVDAVLRAHHAQVREQVWLAAAQARRPAPARRSG